MDVKVFHRYWRQNKSHTFSLSCKVPLLFERDTGRSADLAVYPSSSLLSCLCVFLRQELEKLLSRIQTLENQIKQEEAEATPPDATSSDDNLSAQAAPTTERESDGGGKEEEPSPDRRRRHTAASVIQRRWREHRERVGDWPPPQTGVK